MDGCTWMNLLIWSTFFAFARKPQIIIYFRTIFSSMKAVVKSDKEGCFMPRIQTFSALTNIMLKNTLFVFKSVWCRTNSTTICITNKLEPNLIVEAQLIVKNEISAYDFANHSCVTPICYLPSIKFIQFVSNLSFTIRYSVTYKMVCKNNKVLELCG